MYSSGAPAVADRLTPTGPRFIDAPEREPIFDGIYYQPGEADVCRHRQDLALKLAQSSTTAEAMPLSAYQDWVELDWVSPHGTPETARRLYNKIVEESNESLYELDDIPEPWPGRPDFDNTKAVDELGDWLWTVVATASNSGVHVERAVAGHLQSQGLRLSNNRNIQIAEIDDIITAGHIPYIGLGDVDADDPNTHIDEMSPHPTVLLHAGWVAITGVQQFGNQDDLIMLGAFRDISEQRLAPAVAETISLLGYYAQVWARSSLAEVVAHNVNKVHRRARDHTLKG